MQPGHAVGVFGKEMAIFVIVEELLATTVENPSSTGKKLGQEIKVKDLDRRDGFLDISAWLFAATDSVPLLHRPGQGAEEGPAGPSGGEADGASGRSCWRGL